MTISVMDQMQPYEWSSEESVAYEAAVEAINGAVGACTARIAAERAKDEPDTAVIEAALAARRELAEKRDQLSATNHEQIAEARRHYAQLARDIREGRA